MDGAERPEKQTAFVSEDVDVSAIRASDTAPATAQISGVDKGADPGKAVNTYLRTVEERDLCDPSDESVSSAATTALLIEGALRGARRAEIIAKITSQEDNDAMEEWWLLVYRSLRGRLLAT